MAYVLWRVFMKKYTKVRLGIRNLPVNPAERQTPEKDETWTLASENHEILSTVENGEGNPCGRYLEDEKKASDQPATWEYEPNLPRSHETRKSKTKRVKNYLRKKCKDALSKSGDEGSADRRRDKCTSWYIDDKHEEEIKEDGNDDKSRVNLSKSVESPIELLPEKIDCKGSKSSLYEDATDAGCFSAANVLLCSEKHAPNLQPASPKPGSSLETLILDKPTLDKCESSDTLVAEPPPEFVIKCSTHADSDAVKYTYIEVCETNSECDYSVTCCNDHAELKSHTTPTAPLIQQVRCDVATLVRNLLGPLYGNGVIDLLTRQARDILVCAYHGNLDEFLATFLSPAASLLAEAKRVANENGNESVVPKGWPLTLGEIGLVIHLGELEASALRVGECYLCVRKPRATTTDHSSSVLVQDPVEIALVWRSPMRAPGILGWDREDEYMDWRDSQKRVSTTSEVLGAGGSKNRARRRSREDLVRDSKNNVDVDNNADVLTSDDLLTRGPKSDERVGRSPLALAKSRSTSSVDSWYDETKTDRRRRPRCSSPGKELGVETRPEASRIKRGTSVSSMTVENWKGGISRWEPKTRALGLSDLKTPFALEAAVAVSEKDEDREAQDRLRDVRPDAVSDEDLPGYIGTLLISVERAIERVSLDDLPFPCPSCRNADTDDPLLGCKCVGEACGCGAGDDCGCTRSPPELSHTFEVAGIKHIDSDDEEEVRMGFGAKKKGADLTPPRSIHDLPDHLLTCGLTLPGYKDCADRPVLEYDSTVSPKEAISPVEVASYILYLAHLPSSDRSYTEFTLLITGEPSEELDLLDNAFHLLQGKLRVSHALVLRNSSDDGPGRSLLPRSQIRVIFVDEVTIVKYITRRDHIPNHIEWIAFFKEYDAAMSEWQAAGRKLALAMSELKECTIVPRPLVPLSRLLTDPTVKRTPADADEVIALLEEKAADFFNVEQVRLSLERARRLLTEVGNAATRLEQSCESRRATIRNLTVLRSIEDQAREVLSWLCKKGEETLSRHSRPAATTLPAARIHERDFEKFYFTSMVSLRLPMLVYEFETNHSLISFLNLTHCFSNGGETKEGERSTSENAMKLNF